MTLPGSGADANAVSSARRAEHLDGLRGLAVTAVVVFHCATSLAAIPCGGYLGVPIFFMLSGYLITSRLWASREPASVSTYRRFVIRRIQRLAPAHAAVVLLATPTAILVGMPTRDALLGGLASSTQTMTFYLPLAASVSGPLDVTWTLSVEWWFYLCWPLLLLGLKRARRTTTTVRNLSAVLAFVFYTCSLGLSGPSFYYLPWSNTAVLLTGAAIAMHGQRRAALPKECVTRLSNRVGDTSLALLLLLLLAPSGMIGPGYRWVILPCTAGATGLLLLGCADEGAARRFLSRPALRFLGIRAYSIYLWHFAVLWILQASLGESRGGAAVVVSLASLVPIVWMSFHYLEQPWLRSGSGSTVIATSRPGGARR